MTDRVLTADELAAITERATAEWDANGREGDLDNWQNRAVAAAQDAATLAALAAEAGRDVEALERAAWHIDTGAPCCVRFGMTRDAHDADCMMRLLVAALAAQVARVRELEARTPVTALAALEVGRG